MNMMAQVVYWGKNKTDALTNYEPLETVLKYFHLPISKRA